MNINKDIKIDFNTFDKILNYFKTQNYTFINYTLSDNIKKTVNILFPNLNNQDTEVLFYFTKNIIEKISNYFNFDKTNDNYYKQWTQNNYRDIKGIILLLLPFINNKNTEMIDLNQYLYTHVKSDIPDLSNKNKMDILNSDFKFSNMVIGLLNKKSFPLFEEDGKMKLIYKIIHHNYLGLNKTLQIMNGKYYVNWINIVPILYSYDKNNLVFKESNLYKKTNDGLKLLKRYLNEPKDFFNFTQHKYYGLYLGDIYNTIKIKLYDEIKHIKWLIFPVYVASGNINIIEYLSGQITFDNFLKYSSYEDIDSKDKINFNSYIQNTYTLIEKNNMYIEIWTQILLFLSNEYSKKKCSKKRN